MMAKQGDEGFMDNSLKRQSRQKRNGESLNMRKVDIFEKVNSLYEKDTVKYIVYLSLTELREIEVEEGIGFWGGVGEADAAAGLIGVS
ncbi:unnamed protein product [Sphagnum balticum]